MDIWFWSTGPKTETGSFQQVELGIELSAEDHYPLAGIYKTADEAETWLYGDSFNDEKSPACFELAGYEEILEALSKRVAEFVKKIIAQSW